MRATPFLVAAVALTACRPNLPPDKPLAPPIKTKGFEFTYPTGMRLVVYEDPNAKEFMIDVSHAIGGRDEGPGQGGLAHLAEHMMFKGRQRGPNTPSVWERLLAAGVEFNAFTTADNTDYFEIAKLDQFNNMVALEAERMRDPLANVPDSDFQSEREVVVSEYRQRLETDTQGMSLSWLTEAAFPNNPYGAEVAGSVDGLRKMKLDDVRNWYKSYYTPETTIIVVTGPKKAEDVYKFVGAAFGHLAKGEEGKPPVPYKQRATIGMPKDPAENAPMIVKHAPVEQPTLWMAWTIPGQASPEFPHAEAVAATLNGLLAQRLGDDKRVDDVGCQLDPNEDAGMLICTVTLESADDAQAISEIIKDQLITFADKDEAFGLKYQTNLVRGRMMAELYKSVEQINGAPIAQFLRLTGNPDYLSGMSAQINELSYGDVTSFAYKYISRKRTISMLVAPEKDVSVTVKNEAAPKVGEAMDVDTGSSALSVTPEQIAAVAGKPGLDKVETKTLSNGLKVIVAKRGSIPIVDVRLIVDAPAAEGQASRALRKVELAASWHGFNQESQTHWMKVGAQPIQDFSDGEHIVFGGEAPAGNLPHLLADASQWLDSPGTDGAIFDAEARQMKSDQEASDKRPHDRGWAVLENGLFPNHPYGHITTAAEFADLDHSAGDAWLKDVLRPSRSTLLIVGQVEPSPELWDQIEGFLGSWHAAPTAIGAVQGSLAFAPKRRIIFVSRPHATQAEITLALGMPSANADQRAAISAMRWYLSTDLTKNLREKQGVTYGVYPWSPGHDLALADVLGLTTAVDQSAAARAVQAFLDAMTAMRDKPLSDQDVARARMQLARSYATQFDQVNGASEAAQRAIEHHWAQDFYENYPQSMGKLDAATIQATAKALNVGNEIVVVVGDPDKVLPQLKQAGYNVEVDKNDAAAKADKTKAATKT
ncbi:MAG: insulinase family protein [Deltaproteobacteria bacterium]|nr:insulinase family protein [Deltaproteobacteria bacterium]